MLRIAGPSRSRGASLFTLMAIAGALGLAAQLVPDPEVWVQRRWERRQNNGRVGQAVIKRARPIVPSELARKGGKSRWAGRSPEERQAYSAMLNRAKAAKRHQAGMDEAA